MTFLSVEDRIILLKGVANSVTSTSTPTDRPTQNPDSNGSRKIRTVFNWLSTPFDLRKKENVSLKEFKSGRMHGLLDRTEDPLVNAQANGGYCTRSGSILTDRARTH